MDKIFLILSLLIFSCDEEVQDNSVIGISGTVKESIVSEFQMPVIIKVQKGDGSLVAIAQVEIDRDGDFSTQVTPGGQMSSAGEYTVTAIYNKNEGTTTFTYSGGSGNAAGILVALNQLYALKFDLLILKHIKETSISSINV